MHPKSHLAELVCKEKLIIWNEVPMLHRHCFEAVDHNFRDILRPDNGDHTYIPFGGKVIVFGGDFRQILSVIPKGTRQEVAHASINSHGQPYVAISRVTSRNELKILLTDEYCDCITTTSNVVYKEIFRNL